MASEAPDIFFLVVTSRGHLIPMLDMAKMFATRGARATIVTTSAITPFLQPTLDWAAQSGHPLRLLLLPSLPSSGGGLPERSDSPIFFAAAGSDLREPFRRLLRQRPPACVIFDALFPWAVDVARELGVLAIAFHGSSFFATCAYDAVLHHKLSREKLPVGTESVVVPGLPRRIELLRTQLPDLSVPGIASIVNNIMESQVRSDGVLMNSFYELEPDYVEHHRNVLGRKAWHVGPVSLYSTGNATGEAATRAVDTTGCLSWLDEKKPSSVVYVCFGTLSQLADAQLREIAAALEATGRPFIWVVGNSGSPGGSPKWLPEGFLEKTTWGGKESRGMLVTGWAPQVLILGHGAVGAFVTHCGWNSCLEAITCGVPMVTWPLGAEQFYNEKLVTEVLGVGVEAGSRVWTMREEERDLVGREEIQRAVARVMGDGEEAAGVRRRAAELAAAARGATQVGGSSYADAGRLIEELSIRIWNKSLEVEKQGASEES